MKNFLTIAIIGLCCVASATKFVEEATADTHGPHASDITLAELASLPEGLIVSHTPEEVEATFFGPTGSHYSHQTTVSSTVGPVTIVEYGYLVERDGRWTNAIGIGIQDKYSAKDFAELFNCPDAKLDTGRAYTNEWNESVINNFPEQVGKWYFIGIDAQGHRVKGEANIKLISDKTMDGC